MSPTDFDPELQSLRERSVDRLLSADVFEPSAFSQLLEYLNEKARALRDQHVISKQVLACLRDASASIMSRAEYLPVVRENKSMAGKFDMLLDLMIRGETLTDRQPGVPRII